MTGPELTALIAANTAKAEQQHLAELEKIYLRLIRQAGRRAATMFRTQALTAAVEGDHKWVPPQQDLIDSAQLTADAARKTAEPHRAILKTITEGAVGDIAWDVTHPTSQQLLNAVGSRLTALDDTLRLQVTETIQAGYDQGLSVANTADDIVNKVDEVSVGRANLYARTDLNALSNGGSLLAAQLTEGVGSKTWITAGDERVRETHADADGQTVPVDQPFDIGGEQAMYPGDPDLSDAEGFSCRCSLVYDQEPITASAQQEEFSTQLPVLFRAQMPTQRAPITKVTVNPTPVHFHNQTPELDLAPLGRFLEQIGPLVAAAVAEGQRAELAQALEVFQQAAGRELPTPTVTVAAAEVAAPDLSGIATGIAAGLSPAALETVAVLRELLAVVSGPRRRRVTVNRSRSGEITDLLVTDE